MLKTMKRKWLRVACATMVASSAGFAVAAPVQAQEEAEFVQKIRVLAQAGDEDGEDEDSKEEEIIVKVDGSGKLPKVWLGVMLKEIEGDLAEYLGEVEGVLVGEVMDDSPAEKAGLKKGDVLKAVNDKELEETQVLMSLLADTEVGEALAFEILRNGKEMELKVKPAKRPKRFAGGGVFIPEDMGIDLDLEIDADEINGDVLKALKRLKVGDDDINVFRFGGPGLAIRGGKDAKGASSNNRIAVINNNGENLKVEVNQKDGGPATITVTKDDETEKYTEKDLEELSDDVLKIVKPMLGGDDARIEIRNMPMVLETLEGRLNNEDLQEKLREMAEKHRIIITGQAEEAEKQAAKAREAVEKAMKSQRKIVQGVRIKNQEMEELRSLVEELKQEVKELRSKLKEKGEE